MKIIDLLPSAEAQIEQVAAMLVAGFAGHTLSWRDMPSALDEVQESFEPERITRIAVDDDGIVLGWIGGQPQYDGNVWELHPLVVRPDRQDQGVGRALVADLEVQVQARAPGGCTLWLGSDDEDNRTSLGGVDLYPDPMAKAAAIQNLGRHPYEFYQKMGFVITGVVPDANGWGKPDIFMAKRIPPRA